MRKYISYILATALLFVCCAKTEVGLDESEVLVVSTNNIDLDCDANEVTVLVNSLSSYSVSCDVGWQEWVTPSVTKGASGKTKIKFSFAQNNTISPRNATITIENSTYGVSETISVSQEAGAPFIKSSVTEISANVERFTTKIDVDSNIDYTISSSEKWCHLNRTSGKSGKTTLDITIDANTDTLSRKATITLENKEHKVTKTVSVSQGAFNPVVTLETERLEFAAEGGERYVEISANCDYDATTDADWLSVEQTASGIKVIASSHVEVAERTANILIASEKYNLVHIIKVTQGAFVPEFTVMPSTLDFTSDGGDKSVAITANIDYQVTETADWLTVEQTSAGIKVTALSYVEVVDRTADITINNTKYSLTQTIKVTQGAFKPVLTAVQATLNFTSDGGTKSATITANIDYEVTENADWLSVEQIATGIKVTALSYAEVTERTADITITNTKYNRTQTIIVTQAAFVPQLALATDNVNFTVDGGTMTATITSNIDHQVAVDVDWLSIQENAGSLNLTAKANDEENVRTANVTVSSQKYGITKTIKVSQDAFVVTFAVEPTAMNFTSDGGVKAVTITANIDYDVTESADWLTVEEISSGLNITAPPYAKVTDRTADITITNTKYNRTKIIKVTQTAFVPELVVNFTSLNFTSDGGLQVVTISANIDYEVTVSADWLVIEKTSTGLNVTTPSYAETTDRSADITLTNAKYNITQIINVTQAGATTFVETASGINMKMVRVEGGTFQMGATSEQGSDPNSDESPVHSVTLTSYYIAECEVTQAQWKAIMGTTINEQKPKYDSTYGEGGNYPMYYVNWNEAQEFCEKLSQLTGKAYALPTEAQWEYAARGGEHSQGYKYSGGNSIHDIACYTNNSSATRPVKQKYPNELGLYDMSGNVYEWCSDWYGSYSSSSQTNPSGPSSGSLRVLRGGCWNSDAWACRVSIRFYYNPSYRSNNFGFRVVCIP